MGLLESSYPVKLGRFDNGCIDLYYSQPIGKGVFYNLAVSSTAATSLNYIVLEMNIEDATGWFPALGIFSSGLFSGIVVSKTSTLITVEVNKDSFVSATDLSTFITQYKDVYFNFEVLRHYNGESGDIANALIGDIQIHQTQRVNDNAYYSPYGFMYNQDFKYILTTKTFVVNDMRALEDMLRAGSYVIRSTDTSVVRDLTALSDEPDVIGIGGSTADIVQQPYFGGVQNNECYRASIIESTFKWVNGRIKVKLDLEIRG